MNEIQANPVNAGYDDEPRAAFDPVTEPWLYDGVRTRRSLAFLIDAMAIMALTALAYVVVTVLGVLTLGAGWLLYAITFPVVAIAYVGITLGSRASATPGMRAMGLEMRLWHGGRMYGLIAIVHALAFWFLSGVLAWIFVVIPTLFSSRKRLLHDLILGTVVINDAERVRLLRG
ncbi:MAG: RDD family protein [Hyphomicrobiaceae bacterium]|nr:RDD family protein [Hyphomicrobiaceae bacterium]